MDLAVAEEPRVIHALPGRVRRVQGVSEVRASPLTRNVLVRFDPEATDQESVLTAVRLPEPHEVELEEREPEAPPVHRERRERSGALLGRARIAVRGLDRDPGLARRVVEHLESFPTVRASASQLTGRVLVEFDEHRVQLEDILSAVAGVELPELPGEDRPTHPLDSGPLVQSGVRTGGAVLGLGLLAGRRLFGLTGPPAASPLPATVASVINVLESFPTIRNALHRLLGKNVSDLFFSTSGIALHTLAGSPFTLAIAGAGAVRIFTEARARRKAWRSYEDRVGTAAPARPGAVVRLEPGERAPLAARVLEGTGTAIGRNGLPAPVFSGGNVEAGSRLHGGPFTLELRGEEPFVPEERPAPEGKSLRSRYAQISSWISLTCAAATALLTRSFGRTLMALLLTSPRTAEIGAQLADTGASARVLRAGITVVGTRPERKVRRPDVLLLDGPRTLTDGLENNAVVPQVEGRDAGELLALASGVAAAAGSPWGRAVPAAGRGNAEDGTFDGEGATAEVKGVRYFLGPLADPNSVPAAARLRERGCHLLALRSEGRTLGIVALRPRLAAGVAELVETCQRHGVELKLLSEDTVAARSVAQRAKVPLLVREDTVEAVRERQRNGEVVALVSDSARAAASFAACDLAIGLTSGRSSNFPARADLLAPDLEAIGAVAETGARREAAGRGSVLLSTVGNVLGLILGLRGQSGVQRASTAALVAISGAMADGGMRLRGGKRQASALSLVRDPRPERWGSQSVANVLHSANGPPDGSAVATSCSARC